MGFKVFLVTYPSQFVMFFIMFTDAEKNISIGKTAQNGYRNETVYDCGSEKHTCLGVLSDLLLHHSQSVSSILRHTSCDSLLSAPSNTDDVSPRSLSWCEARQRKSATSSWFSRETGGCSASSSLTPASKRSSA